MKPIVVRMDEVNISTQEQPVIGTQALGPCVGVLIYSKKQQKSVVSHVSTEWQPLLVEILIVLADNKLISVENFNKSLDTLRLHDQFNLFEFDQRNQQAIIAKKGLNITNIDEDDKLEVTIIPGFYQNHYDIVSNMTKFFLSLNPLFTVRSSKLPKKAVRVCMFKDFGSHEFFFDSSTGKFVTEKIKDNLDSKEYRV